MIISIPLARVHAIKPCHPNQRINLILDLSVVTRRNFLSAGRKRQADEAEVTTFDSVKPRRAKGFIAGIWLRSVKIWGCEAMVWG